ncbi:MAG: ketosteroid isomerase-like protein [Cyclobacteriaceae bacterium]|jgi:ketosteroid isomerase-like protein
MYIIRKKSSVIVLTGTLLIISISLFSCKNRRSESTSVENESKEFNIDNVRKEIDVANLEFVNLFNKSDSVGLANMFTYDGKSMEPNEPAFIGRANIQTHYSLVMNAGANKLGLTTIGLWGDEKMLAEEGEYTFIDKDDKPLDKGKYIVLWKMEDGKWKLFRDCYNSDLPMQH